MTWQNSLDEEENTHDDYDYDDDDDEDEDDDRYLCVSSRRAESQKLYKSTRETEEIYCG